MILKWLYWIKTAGCYGLNVPRKAIGNVVSSNKGAHNMWMCTFHNNNWQASKEGVQGSPGRPPVSMPAFVNRKAREISCLCGLLSMWFGLPLKLPTIVYEFSTGEKKHACTSPESQVKRIR